MKIGQQGMGCPGELEFSVNFHKNISLNPEFAFLQLRPMASRYKMANTRITKAEKGKSFCSSSNALGNTKKQNIYDIVYVKIDKFDPSRARKIAHDIGRINCILATEKSKYLLLEPGRWGSADSWLGIPVSWPDISNVGAIIETKSDKLNAAPSQGSHFFHNITTRDINYITLSDTKHDFLNWDWTTFKPTTFDRKFVSHIKLEKPITIKVDGRTSNCVIFINTGTQ